MHPLTCKKVDMQTVVTFSYKKSLFHPCRVIIQIGLQRTRNIFFSVFGVTLSFTVCAMRLNVFLFSSPIFTDGGWDFLFLFPLMSRNFARLNSLSLLVKLFF